MITTEQKHKWGSESLNNYKQPQQKRNPHYIFKHKHIRLLTNERFPSNPQYLDEIRIFHKKTGGRGNHVVHRNDGIT
jgi:hypothetical protein